MIYFLPSKMTSHPAYGRSVRVGMPVVVVITVIAMAVLASLRLNGNTSFITDPVVALAIGGGAVVASVASSKLAAAGNEPAAFHAKWLALSLVFCLLITISAILVYPIGGFWAIVTVAIWNSSTFPPMILMQVTVSSAVRTGAKPPRVHILLGVVLAVAVATNLFLGQTREPFAGITTMVPESWQLTQPILGLIVSTFAELSLLVVPFILWRAALTSDGVVRARIGVAAAGATLTPLLVAFCMLLAIAKDPGEVNAVQGSIVFFVVFGAAVALVSVCAVLASRNSVSSKQLNIIVRSASFAAAGLAIMTLGTFMASLGLHFGATTVAISVSAIAIAVAAFAWFGAGKLIQLMLAPGPEALESAATTVKVAPPVLDVGPGNVEGESGELPSPSALDVIQRERTTLTAKAPTLNSNAATESITPLLGLTAREAEVLSLLADGASNAGIAAQLVISERTVDAHLRAVFVKLNLTADSGVNRRVKATRRWLEHGITDRRHADQT